MSLPIKWYFICLITLFVFSLGFAQNLDFKNIVFTIISQENSRHEQKSLKLKNDISKQTNFSSSVYITHMDLKHPGAWTVLPILPLLWKKHKQKFTWAFFCTDNTVVDSVRLKEVIENLDSKVTFAGRGLTDKDPTIIHHFFTSSNFKYPLFSSGFVMHTDLIEKLLLILKSGKIHKTIDFSIDASHELAMFVKENVNDTELTHSPYFCVNYKKNCATHINNNFVCDQKPAEMKNLYFAIKTCHKYHKDRVPIVKKTWAQRPLHLAFYSDVLDENIPTVKLQVPNTEQGHCGKTQAIIYDVQDKMNSNKDLEWAVISDDDTIFSTYRLQELLGCYKSSDAIAIGERYGYNVFYSYGYNYFTSGGGVVLSKKAINQFDRKKCKCPSDSTPDDMFLLGICLQQLNITMVHIPLFHQARPNDYNEDYLMVGPPISFHKHWMIDPVQVYKEWFQLADVLSDEKNLHVEL